ncbi:hypothetical protein ACP70R_022328 [Stipagrostis hirtigluma subsp. patula]
MVSLPLEDRLKKWFTEVSQVNQFNALMHLAPDYSEEEILKVLPEYADLVRGLWVCKSSLLFHDGYASKRDRVLLEFTRKDSIPENILEAVIRKDDPRRRIVLAPLCRKRVILKDYKFISAADLSFLKRYPHIVSEQECAWSARETILRDSQEMCSTMAKKTKNPTRSNVSSKGPHPNVSNGRDGPSQGIENNVRSVLNTVFTGSKVRSLQAVIRELRQLAAKYASNRKDGPKLQALSNAAKSCASLPHKELDESIRLVADLVHGVYVARDDKKMSPRKLLILLFLGKEPNATVTKQEILDFAAKHLGREMTEKEYHLAVTEICNSTGDGHLVLKNGDEP